MKINTLLIDDDPVWRDIISRIIGMIPSLNLVAVCASAIEGYARLSESDIDLLICDIEMPDMSGLSLVKSLRQPPLVIFVTVHRDYALDCYEVSPIDFLLKPLVYDRFLVSIEKVRQRLEQNAESSLIEPYFFIRENSTYEQIAYKDVLYIKAQDYLVQIITKERTYSPVLSIAKLEEKLNQGVFLRVNRAYLVHRNMIASVSKNDVVLKDGQKIAIGEQYRNKINKKHIEDYSIAR